MGASESTPLSDDLLQQIRGNMAFSSAATGASESIAPAELPPIPPSPSCSMASTANPLASILKLPPPAQPPMHVHTKADLEQSQAAYSELLSSAKAYRQALAALSAAASSFGTSLESCARLKEARSEPLSNPPSSVPTSNTTSRPCTADNLMAASGVHHLIANHQLIISETVHRAFEVPLQHEIDAYWRRVAEEAAAYQAESKQRTHQIQAMEKAGLKLQRERKRDIQRIRSYLVSLTELYDNLTNLHTSHSQTLLRESQATSQRILDSSSSLVRASLEIFESLARKGWTGGGLDELLERSKDLFAAEPDAEPSTREIFSILPSKSILAGNMSDGESARGERYVSLAKDDEADDSVSVFSAGGGLGEALYSPRGSKAGVTPMKRHEEVDEEAWPAEGAGPILSAAEEGEEGIAEPDADAAADAEREHKREITGGSPAAKVQRSAAQQRAWTKLARGMATACKEAALTEAGPEQEKPRLPILPAPPTIPTLQTPG